MTAKPIIGQERVKLADSLFSKGKWRVVGGQAQKMIASSDWICFMILPPAFSPVQDRSKVSFLPSFVTVSKKRGILAQIFIIELLLCGAPQGS